MVPQLYAVGVSDSRRYYTNAQGEPVFLIGYYFWASVTPGYYIDRPTDYHRLIDRAVDNDLNYLRISLGVNRFTSKTEPPSFDDQTTPVPFEYVNNRADLDSWDQQFWDGLAEQCQYAQDRGVLLHVSLFDGVDIRAGEEAYRWNNSYWNRDNQVRDFFGDLDSNNDDDTDQPGEFYRLEDFELDTGVGYYQRRLIDKAIATVQQAECEANVLYEVGNELYGAPTEWKASVIEYIKAQTDQAVTVNEGGKPENMDGWVQHKADSVAETKANVAEIVGRGYPAMEDPDGPPEMSYADADQARQAAWYSLSGGAAGWGGFSFDVIETAESWDDTKGIYLGNLQRFLKQQAVPMDQMYPDHSLVSRPEINSALVQSGQYYLVYVLEDALVEVDLSAVPETATVQLYDPISGSVVHTFTVTGQRHVIINKPDRVDDWVVYISADKPIDPPTQPSTCGPADVDGSNSINFQDYLLLARNFLRQPLPNPEADLTGDGAVNVADYLILLRHSWNACS